MRTDLPIINSLSSNLARRRARAHTSDAFAIVRGIRVSKKSYGYPPFVPLCRRQDRSYDNCEIGGYRRIYRDRGLIANDPLKIIANRVGSNVVGRYSKTRD